MHLCVKLRNFAQDFPSECSITMAWYPGDGHDSTDSVDEASVGLIAPKSESGTKSPAKQQRSSISKSFLGVLLLLSNMAWAGFCLMLWQTLYVPPDLALKLAGQIGFETDFGTLTSMI